jgi:hypothetical protein
MKIKFENSISEIDSYLLKLDVDVVKSFNYFKINNLNNTIENGINYIKKSFINGQWYDYYNQGGISNMWSTAFILSKIVSNSNFKKIFENEIKLASKFILLSKSPNNLWSYSKSWIDDADSTNFALISLHFLDLLENYNHDNWSAYFNGNYFSTYKNQKFLLNSLSDNNIKDVSGWCADHYCVSAVSLYYLACSNNKTNKLKKLLNNFKALDLNSIQAYWWSDNIYTLYYLFLAYKKLNIISELQKIQDYVGSKIKYDFYEDYYGKNLFYTALALEIIFENPRYQNLSNKLAEFLIKNQFDDGSWLESNSLCFPNPNDKRPTNKGYDIKNFGVGVRSHEFNRLFTSISALRSLYLWKNQN